MNKKIDHTTVAWMARTGFHPSAIARRLGCSRRQIDRILKAANTPGGQRKDFENEHYLWEHYAAWGEPHSKIARRFGVSRQAVHKHLNLNLNQKRLAS